MKQSCPFDKSHRFQTIQKLRTHIKKCKSLNKLNFEQCQYNSDHWVNFSQIKQHEQQCKINQNNQKQSMMNQISMSNDSVINALIGVLDCSKLNGIEQELSILSHEQEEKEREKEEMMKNNHRKKKKIIVQEQKDVKWSQPCFRKWAINCYNFNKGNLINSENSNIFNKSIF